jgi:hypothetical protein
MSTRGTATQWQLEKMNNTLFKAWESHTSIYGPYQEHQFKLSLHTPLNKYWKILYASLLPL